MSSITLGFVGYAEPATADAASRYEDAVLELLDDHGARVLFRGRRRADQAAELPLEIHVLEFPDRPALDAYLADARRTALIEEFGDVFTVKHAAELDPLTNAL
jgi:uncharacterized protein (DUF1330 family)